ncbi:MAG TPA: NADH-quinone oxidoreductase subunit L [Flavobacteriales bacterium]|nr:NADH-quinone oxidoreductase subunit L [Flavobacteriales bacterium]
MSTFEYIYWIPLIPLLMFLFLGFTAKEIKEPISGYIGTAGLLTVFGMSLYTAYQYFFVSGLVNGKYEPIKVMIKEGWVNFTDKLAIDIGILVDPISVMMLVVVSTISLMVHIYSLGYMHSDTGFSRFYAYLSLFTFSMLGLVLSSNLFLIYIFWELVGVSSFLLIGFYFEKPSAVAASKKAFIVTRFADMFFLIGILMIGYFAQSFDFETLNSPSTYETIQSWIVHHQIPSFLGLSVITWALILIYIGGMGKSAMFPLHIWLPDAMEGPTPVSALIHAATMVVAGVFLVARLYPLYYHVEDGFALRVVAVVGAFSALFAAIIALTQEDIKRVLAFSTMSQIGYMMMALGVSGFEGHEGLGYMAGMFHLFTHAMFKALLFLTAGAIIHAVHSNFMKDMGGLNKYMPVSSIVFLIAALAISGIPPFAGFYSKDEILTAAFEYNVFIWLIGFLVAGLTAFYMFRLYFRIFFNKQTDYGDHKPHEAPWTMLVAMIFLGLMTIIAGFIPFSQIVSADRMPFHSHIHWGDPTVIASILMAASGIGIAYLMYYRETDYPAKVANAMGTGYKWAKHKFYMDELYIFITHKIIFDRISKPIAWFDRNVIDGFMNLLGVTVEKLSERIKFLQTGRMQDYAMYFVSGVIAIVMLVIYFR